MMAEYVLKCLSLGYFIAKLITFAFLMQVRAGNSNKQ